MTSAALLTCGHGACTGGCARRRAVAASIQCSDCNPAALNHSVLQTCFPAHDEYCVNPESLPSRQCHTKLFYYYFVICHVLKVSVSSVNTVFHQIKMSWSSVKSRHYTVSECRKKGCVTKLVRQPALSLCQCASASIMSYTTYILLQAAAHCQHRGISLCTQILFHMCRCDGVHTVSLADSHAVEQTLAANALEGPGAELISRTHCTKAIHATTMAHLPHHNPACQVHCLQGLIT
jgi:hypothetical protein